MPLISPLPTPTLASAAALRKRVLVSFKEWLVAVSFSFITPQAPHIASYFNLDVSSTDLRRKIRSQFERHRHVSDSRIIDRLLFLSRLEYEETLNGWKQKTHVMRFSFVF